MPDYKELLGFPGPLVPARTHKGEVIKFCQNKIQNAKQKEGSGDTIGKSFDFVTKYKIKLGIMQSHVSQKTFKHLSFSYFS